MNVLYIYAHPDDPSSLNATLRDQAAGVLTSLGHTVEHADLYRMGFRPVLDAGDFPDRALPGRFVPSVEIRHALERGTVPPDVAAEMERLRAADLVVIQFPLWWSSVPAILKGWFDRVLSFAHAADAEGPARPPFVRDKRFLLVTTLEAPEEAFGDGRRAPLRDLLAPIETETLGFVGMDGLPPFLVHGVTPDRGPDWIAAQAERLKAHLVVLLTGL